MGILNLDWLAILVAAIAGMLIGVAWYSPLLFGEAWLRALARRRPDRARHLGRLPLGTRPVA